MHWQPSLIWLHVVSDSLIALAYLCIPLALFHFVRKRRDIPFHWMFISFGVFILSCGTTHIMAAVTLWQPLYHLDGLIKALTAAASLITAAFLFRLMPTLLLIPSRKELAQAEERTAESQRLNLRLESQLARERDLVGQMRDQERLLQRTDEGLRQSLLEQEILLKEMHHRVKNNLFVMSSLLRMQANSIENPRAATALYDSERRLLSMALIHERLYSGGNAPMSAIDFDEYCELLGNDLLASYAGEPSRITLHYDLAPIRLSVEQAIPCGLIVNELLTNAFKYAYPGEMRGQISISLRVSVPNSVALTVADQGIGFPADFSLEGSKSLGLQIVQLLAKQIDGSLWFHGAPGASLELQFPLQS